jgi:glycosyltransferase involved in cell wall biosynthesis
MPETTAAAPSGARRVLVVTPFVWEGGMGRGKPTVYYTLRGFQHAGYEVHVVTATHRRDQVAESCDGLHVHYFHIPIAVGPFAFDAWHSFLTLVRAEPSAVLRHARFRLWWLQFVVLGVRRALAVARAHPPAFTYGVNNPGIPVTWWVARRLGVPTFGRIMGSEIAQLAGVDRDDPAATRRRPDPATAVKLALARFDELLAFKLPTDALIVTDDGQIGPRTVIHWLGVPADRLWLWRNGIDLDRFRGAPDRDGARRELGIDRGRPVVLWVSQLIDWKQPHLLVDALPAVVAAAPEALCVVVGDGPARGEMERRAAALGVGDRVRFAGFVDQSRVPLYYRAADVFVACYRRANVSNTLLEAMASGLAVVTLDNGRTREVVRHEENGLLVDPAHPETLGPAVARVLADPALRAALGQGASHWARDHLDTWDERIAREVRGIEAILARRGT